jgi:hypothetical protein
MVLAITHHRFCLPRYQPRRRPKKSYFGAQWLAYSLPYRRFAGTLTDTCARLRADVTRYAFIAVDSHHLLFAGLPAHW